MLSWQDSSEIVVGLLLAKRIPYDAVKPKDCFPPFDRMVRIIQHGTTNPEELVKKIGLNTFQVCLYAIENLNGQAALDWIGLQKKLKARYTAGVKLEKIAIKLQRGEEVDFKKTKKLLASLQ